MGATVNPAEIFGQNVFNDTVMKERLPKKIYQELKKTIEDGAELSPVVAEVVANAMKDWAVEKGATHYSGEAGCIYFSAPPGRKDDSGILRKGIDQRGAGCLLLPVRRSACHI